LNLSNEPVDAAILGTALAEVAARQIAHNPQFGREVRELYQELASSRRSTPPRPSRRALAPLEPLRHAGGEVDPFSPPDPRKLIYVYGVDKLGRALQDYTMDMLKQTVENVQREHPGTKPRTKSSKAALIEYIVQYSTNGR
jgi:hypothetical protein